MTTTVCGVSRSGCVYLGDATFGDFALDGDEFRDASDVERTASGAKVARTAVPASSASMARPGVNVPPTPGDCTEPMRGSASTTLRPVTRSILRERGLERTRRDVELQLPRVLGGAARGLPGSLVFDRPRRGSGRSRSRRRRSGQRGAKHDGPL